MRTHVVREGARGFECNGEGPFACEECRGIRRCTWKHDIPWSAERVRERLFWWAIGALMTGGFWIELGKRLR